jgi:hypothetical protein
MDADTLPQVQQQQQQLELHSYSQAQPVMMSSAPTSAGVLHSQVGNADSGGFLSNTGTLFGWTISNNTTNQSYGDTLNGSNDNTADHDPIFGGTAVEIGFDMSFIERSDELFPATAMDHQDG